MGVPIAAGITGQPFISADERKNADTTAYNAGFVSIVPFENDLTASNAKFNKLQPLAHALND